MNVVHTSQIILRNRKEIKKFLDSCTEKIGNEYNTAIGNQTKLNNLITKFLAQKLLQVFFAIPIMFISLYMTIVVVGNRSVNERDTFLICLVAVAIIILCTFLDSKVVEYEKLTNQKQLLIKQEELIDKVKNSGCLYGHFLDTNLIHDLYVFLFVVIGICVGIVLTMRVNTNEGFLFYDDKDGEYVVVYQTEELIVLERAEHRENELIIHIDDQLYLENNQIKLKYRPINSYSLVN